MVSQKYRWDFIGLSTDTKPTSETSEKVVNGSTYYCSDTSKLYVYCDGTWYERKPLGGGGGGGTSNFNDLSNRPKYNGSEMTGSTNIPEVKNYTAGTNVSISDQNVISATDTTYTAGTNVSISDQNVISATDTTYSAFTGTDGTSAGAAGLVPAPATTDAGKFLKADGTWDTAGGGGGPTVVQTTGTSTTDVMSQNAVTSMVFADPSTKGKVNIGGSGVGVDGVAIGKGAYSGDNTSGSGTVAIGRTANTYGGTNAVAIGNAARARSENAISIGYYAGHPTADTQYKGAISLGAYSEAHAKGEMNIGSSETSYGYNSSNYRLLTGLYDPQSAHDAATKGYVDGKVLSNAGAPTTSTVGTVGQLLEDTTNGKLYQCTAVTPGTDPDPDTYTWVEVGAGGGGASNCRELTSADYNYPANNPTTVALWLLEPGFYWWDFTFGDNGGITFTTSESGSILNGNMRNYSNNVMVTYTAGPSTAGKIIKAFARSCLTSNPTFGWAPYVPYYINTTTGAVVNFQTDAIPVGRGDLTT